MPTPPVRRGLSAAEVVASRQQHGANLISPPPRPAWWREYLSKFDDPVVRILLLAAVLAIVVGAVDGRAAEGVGILIAVFLATFLAFWNEHRAARAFDVLARTDDDTPVTVVRDGQHTRVPKRDLVVGDLVGVEVGEEVPADGMVIEAVSLLVSESKLTGESKPVHKRPGDEPGDHTAYGPGRVLRGSTVADGYGLLEVTAVGDSTEFGRTLRQSTEATGGRSPLDRQLARLSRVIGVVGFSAAVLTFAALVSRGVWIGSLVLTTGQWLVAAGLAGAAAVALSGVWLPVARDAVALARGKLTTDEPDDDGESGWWAATRPWVWSLLGGVTVFAVAVGGAVTAELVPADPNGWLPAGAAREFLRDFLIAVTIIVVAVPEGLAMSVTLSLAYAMRRMTAQQTLVRRMRATEAIGAATVICSDKTGTLTANEMRVIAAEFAGETWDGLPTDPVVRTMVVEAIAVNSTAQLGRADGVVRPLGNPTEGALLLWLDASGEDYQAVRGQFTLHTRWTFSTERKYMATLGVSTDAKEVLHVKGAPEVLLAVCDRQYTRSGLLPLTDADRASISTALAGYQARGMRTLGFAFRLGGGPADDPLAGGLVWLGLVAVADPVRADVPAAAAACRQAGIAVKLVTGDTSVTAAELARQIGVLPAAPPAGALLTGVEFAALDDRAASEAAARLTVLARARPSDKLRLVTLLKARGEVVAVTGDGVNDGPALNHADVALAMGKSGTAVAKEASDIVLLDDSFASVVTAVKWGRGLYENIQRFVLFQLTINVCALGLAVLGPFIGCELPLTVMQMLWVNLIMDTFAALALATEPPHPGVLNRPPRNPAAFIISRPMARFILGVGGLFLLVLVGMILWLHPPADEPSHAGTLLFTAFVLLQFWNLFNAKAWGRGRPVLPALGSNPSFLGIAAVILVGQFLIVQFGGAVFRTVPLSWAEWGWLLAVTSLVFWVGEAWRLASDRGRNRRPSPDR